MNNSGGRIHYIDVFKGICILLVVIHHVPFALGLSKYGTPVWGIDAMQNFIVGFFMPGFL